MGAVLVDVVRAPGVPAGRDGADRPRSLWSDAWRDLRHNPVFVVAALVILFLVVISVWPQLIAPGNPLSCDGCSGRVEGRRGRRVATLRATEEMPRLVSRPAPRRLKPAAPAGGSARPTPAARSASAP